MSEEKPEFKITDRRLFNPDGSAREVERDESDRSAAYSSVLETASGAATAPQSRGEAPPPGDTKDRPERSPVDEGGDPTPFVNLVMFIASPAAAALGMTEHPRGAAPELDLPLAKHCIDLLATLREKTRGNLSQQEEQVTEGLLAELRMQYVSLVNTRPASASPNRFSGSDITGGR